MTTTPHTHTRIAAVEAELLVLADREQEYLEAAEHYAKERDRFDALSQHSEANSWHAMSKIYLAAAAAEAVEAAGLRTRGIA